jgi:hypothetical protein
MIKNVHKWEKAVILLLNADGWDLTHTGKGFEHYDAIGYAPEKNGKRAEVVIEFKFRNKYYKEKMLEVYKYDKLIETGRIALYFVNDPKGNYMFWLNNLKDLKVKDMYCPDTTLWTKKKVLKPCYLIDESQASIINLSGFKK